MNVSKGQAKIFIIVILVIATSIFIYEGYQHLFNSQDRNRINEFPEKIGEYSRTNVLLDDLLRSDMQSSAMITYSDPDSETWALVHITIYKTENFAETEYKKAGNTGRTECLIGQLEGVCKTDSSYGRVNFTFGWLEGNKIRNIGVSEKKEDYEDIDKVEERCEEKMLLFIEAFEET